MVPLATADDVQARYPTQLTAEQRLYVQTLLTDASATIRQFTRQQFTLSQTTERIRPIGYKVKLPQAPVVSVDQVFIVDCLQPGELLPLPLSAWLWDGAQEVWLGQMDIVVNLPEDVLDLFRYTTPLLQITYTHGYPASPDIAVAVACSMVIRVLDIPGALGMQGQNVGPFGYRLSATGQDGILALSDSEKAALMPFRRPVAAVELR